MAKIKYSWIEYPDSPKTTECSRRFASGGAAIGLIVTFGCYIELVGIFGGVGTLAKKGEWMDLILGIAVAVVVGSLIWFYLIFYFLWSSKKIDSAYLEENYGKPSFKIEDNTYKSRLTLQNEINMNFKNELRDNSKKFIKVYLIVLFSLYAIAFLYHLLAGNF